MTASHTPTTPKSINEMDLWPSTGRERGELRALFHIRENAMVFYVLLNYWLNIKYKQKTVVFIDIVLFLAPLQLQRQLQEDDQLRTHAGRHNKQNAAVCTTPIKIQRKGQMVGF